MGPAKVVGLAVLCVCSLLVGLYAYACQWRLSELPVSVDEERLAYPVRVAGLVVGDAARLRFLAESWPPGTRLELVDAEGGRQTIELGLRQGQFALVVTGISGLTFLVVAFAIFAPRLGTAGVASFFGVSLLYGLGILCGGVFFPRSPLWPVAAISLLQILCLCALPVLFVRLVLTFPRRSSLLARAPWLVPVLTVVGATLAGWQASVYLAFARDPSPARGLALEFPFAAADVFMVAATLAGVTFLAARVRRLELTRERQQVRWLLWGFALGAAPYVFLRTVPALLRAPPPLPDAVDRLVELAIPASFVMAVVRHQFLDVDVIIRRSLIYGLLAAAALGLYLAIGLSFGVELARPFGLQRWILAFGLGLVAGAAYLPLRRWLGTWIDRTFFKLAHDQGQALRRLSAELATAASMTDVADLLARAIDAHLGPRSLGVVIEGASGPRVAGNLSPELLATALAAQKDQPDPLGSLYAAAQATSLPEFEGAGFPPALAAADVAIVVPLAAGGSLQGVVLLGLRPTNRRYIEPDLAFLGECRRLAGQALERIALQRAVAAEVLAREQFALLSEHKSQFLSQVAHDLRTPLAGITWSARNLLDGLAGDLTASQRAYLEAIARSGGILARLVDNLLEMSRLERAETRLDLEDVDVEEIWRSAADAVRPVGAHKGVDVVVQPGASSAVRADRGKLLEVALNLLDNAVKYTAPQSEVAVTWVTSEPGLVTMRVRDHGPGLQGQPIGDLLARFVQGLPSPHSARQGFGLGLSIAASYLRLMAGTITAFDNPDGGATFECRLPRADGIAGEHHESIRPDRR